MVNVGSNILVLFAIAAALAFFFPLWKDGICKQLTIKPVISSLVPFLFVVIPCAALFGILAALGSSFNIGLACFAGAALVFFGISSIGLSPQLQGVALLIGAVLFTVGMPSDSDQMALSAVLIGLLVGKISGGLLLQRDRALDDLMPALTWLSGVLWLSTIDDQGTTGVKQGLLLGTISIVLLLRIFGRPFMTDDRWLLKRLVLSSSGGLCVLIVVTKLLLKPDLAPLALLVGGAMFATYLFQNFALAGEENDAIGTGGIKLLLVLGMLTLVATRFFGMFGLVLMAPVAFIAPRFSLGQYIGLFFIVRVLLQVFISVYNSNVTGINIMHAYTGAAQYAGFITIAALALFMKDMKDRRVITAVFIGAGALVPIVSNYFLHAEPTCSLLVAALVAAIIFAVLGPAFQPGGLKERCENLLLLPALMAVVGITFNGLLEAGEAATSEFKTTILGYGLGATVVCFLLAWLIANHFKKGDAVGAVGSK